VAQYWAMAYSLKNSDVNNCSSFKCSVTLHFSRDGGVFRRLCIAHIIVATIQLKR